MMEVFDAHISRNDVINFPLCLKV